MKFAYWRVKFATPSEIFANAKVIGYKFNKREEDILPYKGCEIEFVARFVCGSCKKRARVKGNKSFYSCSVRFYK